MSALHVENLSHELSLGLGQEEALLGKLEAVGLVEIAQLSECEVHLLERILEAFLDALLLDLFKLGEELDKHGLGVFLACLLVLLLGLCRLFIEDLFELVDDFINQFLVSYQLFFEVFECD